MFVVGGLVGGYFVLCVEYGNGVKKFCDFFFCLEFFVVFSC